MKNILVSMLFLLGAICLASPVSAQSVLCIAKKSSVKNGKLSTKKLLKVVSGSACPSKYRSLLSTTSFTGATGATGANGQLRIYGDGSAGVLTTSGSATLPSANMQFTDCNITAGSTLSVASGTVLRCTGNVVIEGSISVGPGATGGQVISVPSTNVYTSASRSANPGRVRPVAANGEMGSSAQLLSGGSFGFVMSQEEVNVGYTFNMFGGGGGGGSVGLGGSGGGYFAILAGGTITMRGSGAIAAVPFNGALGSGGGGGGFVVLASKTSIAIPSSISINVNGGDGGSSSAGNGPGGGGGGGGIYIISPSNTVDSTGLSFAGGNPGDETITQVSDTIAIAGGAGGASIGSGGSGGNINPTRPVTASSALAGSVGALTVLAADPTALF